MKILLLLTITGILSLLTAETNETFESKQIHIHAMSPEVNLSAFEDQYTVHEYRYVHTNPHSELPDVREAEKIFAMTGLTPVIPDLDQLDRDMLFMKVRNNWELDRIIKDYPLLKGHEAKLEHLHRIIGKPEGETGN